VIFEVADSELVEGLENEPVVLDGISDAQHDWICRTKDDSGKCAGPAVTWYQDLAAQDVMLAASGPEEWQRVDPDDPQPEARPVDGTEVSGLVVATDRIAFDVDALGSPVLVKASYFPNWRVQGADGPYRVAPNLMVVIPTAERVELTYGREPVEWIAYALTALGIALAILLALLPPVRGRKEPGDAPLAHDDGPTEGDEPADRAVPSGPAHAVP
jgi:hypothetical protein